ncbi:MAG: RNA-binding protein [Acidobacteria bacterium]|nr:MAG: RNA-binding protein [Acidobacteriota bacterium]
MFVNVWLRGGSRIGEAGIEMNALGLGSGARSRRKAILVLLLGATLLAGSVKITAQKSNAPEQKERDPSLTAVNFVDIATHAGLTARTEAGGEKAKKYIIETTGSGAAFIDYDNDGWPDIFLVNGTTLEGFPKGQEPTSHLYHNNHDGTFTDVTRKAGLGLMGWGQGVCAGDYDNDGWTDLYVTFWGHSVLLHNNGDGTFSDVTKKAGLWHEDARWETGCAFVDYDRDGRVDVFVSQYVDLDLDKTPVPGSSNNCIWKGIPVMCGPRGLKGTHSELYHNNGDGTFSDVSEKSGVAKTGAYYCFTVLTGDFDNDGWPDIFVTCDSTPSLLFHNSHDGTFSETGVSAGVAFNEDGREQAGMGAYAADYDGDGSLDIIRTNFSDDTPTLYHNNGDGTFTDVTNQAGLGSSTQLLGWGATFVDIDNDGWPDIFLANGHVYPEVDGKGFRTTFRERKALYLNQRNGRFRDISQNSGPGVSALFNSHGVATADFDNDGTVEILVNNSHDPPSLLKNLGEHQNWLIVKLIGTKSNHDAIGARVTVQAKGHRQVQEVRSGGGYDSQSDFRLHFGVDSAAKVERIAIRWPSGLNEKLENVSANQILTVKEGVQTSRP